ncbi:TadE/TadG family type IV pilus assembly protein [Candidatus Nucleicultrix amoebiphila]|jgi:Flp pilus assembly protein TadG|uniref:TadE/TadG family type IV pilus assembly protein n=1 Tax=Candidatus Nucleicultrix amoebiphila TaxID=1509244 RepID=UPI000A270859|nr:TadE/TadG family type IV pilus assembly protein [Candidatus Nucleicultrix amoebiphila]
MLKVLPYFCRHTRGNALIEFAFAAPVFILIVFGVIDFGISMWEKSYLNYALSNTARYAFIHPDASENDLTNYAKTQIRGITKTISFNVVIVPKTYVDLTGTLQYKFFGLPFSPMNIVITIRQPLPPS